MNRRFALSGTVVIALACSDSSSAPHTGTGARTPARIAEVSGVVGSTPSGFETADSVAIRVTDSAGSPIAGQIVTFSIVAGGGTASPATKATGAAGIARVSWTVGAPGPQRVRATVGSLSVDITLNAVSCRQLTLGVGGVETLNPEDGACAILNGEGKGYLITIANPTNSPLLSVGYTGRGLAAAAVPGFGESEEDFHAALLAQNTELLQRYHPQPRALHAATDVVAQAARPAVGDLIPMKVPDISADACTAFSPAVARLTSAAVKLSQPGFSGIKPFDDAWLEESSAEIAMELLSRVTYDRPAKSNLDYATAIGREARPASGLPLNMFHPFTCLYTYFAAPETHSLVGPVDASDFTFYGSGWAFLRWAIDTYASNEAAFLTAMNREVSHWGIANIENLTGKPFAQLFGEFSIAMALDDYPGFTPTDAKYSFPSWNVRSIFAGLNADFPGTFPLAAPLKVHSNAFGKFAVDGSGVRGGGFSIIELTGTPTSKQLLELRGVNGAPFPPMLRVNVVRVQ